MECYGDSLADIGRQLDGHAQRHIDPAGDGVAHRYGDGHRHSHQKATATPKVTRTFTPSLTRTDRPTRITSPTHTSTPTFSLTRTVTPTYTDTKTQTQSATITPTYTITPGSPGLDDVEVYPNPYRGGEGRITFKLRAPADKVMLKIYTCSGRLVLWKEGRQADYGGYLSFGFEGKDNLGHPLANGVYFFVVEVSSPDGGAAVDRRIGKIVILR